MIEAAPVGLTRGRLSFSPPGGDETTGSVFFDNVADP